MGEVLGSGRVYHGRIKSCTSGLFYCWQCEEDVLSVEGMSPVCPHCSGEFLEKRHATESPHTDEHPDNAARSGVSTPSIEEEGSVALSQKSSENEGAKKEEVGKMNKNKKKKHKKSKKKAEKPPGSLTTNDLYEEPEGIKIYQQDESREEEIGTVRKTQGVFQGKPKKRWNKEEIVILNDDKDDKADEDDESRKIDRDVKIEKEEKKKWTDEEKESRLKEMEKEVRGEAYPNMKGMKEEMIPGTNYKAEKEKQEAKKEEQRRLEKEKDLRCRDHEDGDKDRKKKSDKQQRAREEEARRKKEQEEREEKIRLGEMRRKKEEEKRREEEERNAKDREEANERVRKNLESKRKKFDTKQRHKKFGKRT